MISVQQLVEPALRDLEEPSRARSNARLPHPLTTRSWSVVAMALPLSLAPRRNDSPAVRGIGPDEHRHRLYPGAKRESGRLSLRSRRRADAIEEEVRHTWPEPNQRSRWRGGVGRRLTKARSDARGRPGSSARRSSARWPPALRERRGSPSFLVVACRRSSRSSRSSLTSRRVGDEPYRIRRHPVRGNPLLAHGGRGSDPPPLRHGPVPTRTTADGARATTPGDRSHAHRDAARHHATGPVPRTRDDPSRLVGNLMLSSPLPAGVYDSPPGNVYSTLHSLDARCGDHLVARRERGPGKTAGRLSIAFYRPARSRTPDIRSGEDHPSRP
jgi:hypothetical protein